jgi:hypothetical protein
MSEQPARQAGGAHAASMDPAPAATSTDQQPRGQRMSRDGKHWRHEHQDNRRRCNRAQGACRPLRGGLERTGHRAAPQAHRPAVGRGGRAHPRTTTGGPRDRRDTGHDPHAQAGGHDALQVRVTRSYQQFIAPGEFISGPGTTPRAWTTSSSSTGRWCAPGMARWRPSAWRSLCWTTTAGSRIDYQFIER